MPLHPMVGQDGFVTNFSQMIATTNDVPGWDDKDGALQVTIASLSHVLIQVGSGNLERNWGLVYAISPMSDIELCCFCS